MKTILEICAGDAGSLEAGILGGADRIEFCCALPLGGLTPLPGIVRETKLRLGKPTPVNVLIRPREGDFLYSDAELDIFDEHMRQWLFEADGLVVGALTADGRVDERACRRFIAAADNKPLTFHRAIDQSRDPLEALRAVIDLGFARVLTSGGAPTAAEGIPMLEEMVKIADGRIEIIAGGGVNPGNVARIIRETGVPAVHASASHIVASGMIYRRAVSMAAGSDEYSRKVTDIQTVRELAALVRSEE